MTDRSSTVDRAVAALTALALHPEGMTLSDLARDLDTHRAPLYRVLASLENGHLIERDSRKSYHLGVGTLSLARSFASRLPSHLDRILTSLADDTGATASIVHWHLDVATVIAAAAPRTPGEHVFAPPGSQVPPGPSATHAALAATSSDSADDDEHVAFARVHGYAHVRPPGGGRFSLAVAIRPVEVSRPSHAVTLTALRDFRADEADLLRRAAREIEVLGVGLSL